MRTRVRRVLSSGVLAASLSVLLPQPGWAQAPKIAVPAPVTIEQPDAQRTKEELSQLLDRYPPALKGVFANDPSLLTNQAYLAPYPALVSFLNAHPDIARNPTFYVGGAPGSGYRPDRRSDVMEMWRDVLQALAVFAGFGMAIGLLIWLIRTLIDYRRWSRLAKVQTDVHTKLLDRFTANDDLLNYIQSPAGSKFLESSPIKLDAGPRSMGAPLGRILLSVQAGVVLAAAGIGLMVISAQVSADASEPFHAMGILGIALGLGFVISAIISFLISQRLGLIERPSPAVRVERPSLQG